MGPRRIAEIPLSINLQKLKRMGKVDPQVQKLCLSLTSQSYSKQYMGFVGINIFRPILAGEILVEGDTYNAVKFTAEITANRCKDPEYTGNIWTVIKIYNGRDGEYEYDNLFAKTIAGNKKSGPNEDANEDAMAVIVNPSTGEKTLAVLDGIGGEKGGDYASSLAAETIVSSTAENKSLLETIEAAHYTIRDKRKEKPEFSKMGTTAAIVDIDEGAGFGIGQYLSVGDSRILCIKDGNLFLLNPLHDLGFKEWWTINRIIYPHSIPLTKEIIESIIKISRRATVRWGGYNPLEYCLGVDLPDDLVKKQVLLGQNDTILLATDFLSFELLALDEAREILLSSKLTNKEKAGKLIQLAKDNFERIDDATMIFYTIP